MWKRLKSDVTRGAAAGMLATLTVGVVEVVIGAPAVLALEGWGRVAYVALGLTVTVIAALSVAVGIGLASGAVRLSLGIARGGEAARSWPGLWATDEDAALSAALSVARPGGTGDAAVVHGVCVAVVVLAGLQSLTVSYLVTHFRSPGLIGLVAAVVSVGWVMVATVCGMAGARAFRSVVRRPLWPERVAAGLRDVRLALGLWLVGAWAMLGAASLSWEALTIVFPYRLALSASILVGLLLWLAPRIGAERGGSRRRTIAIAGAALSLVALTVATLWSWSGNSKARRRVLESPTLALFADVAYRLTDVDRDGYSSVLGGGDCRAFDSAFHPGATDIPGDGLDQNCANGDARVHERPSPYPDVPLPARLARSDYSILLVTIDTLRYDRTGFGGADRPTTPALDRLAARATWFEHGYSTGTYTAEVLPALVASQYFTELPKGPPQHVFHEPRALLPEAQTLAEVLHSAGYKTGLFAAMRYFDDWGVEQGVETLVNQKRDEVSSAPGITDAALAWLEGLDPNENWFGWVHYTEPHEPYLPHPDGVAFGSKPLERYDAEVRYADDQLARLLDWIERDPRRAERTIIAVTSDHGELFGEGGRKFHGYVLLEPVIHVPLLIALPGAPARRSNTPASILDIAPTLVALAGVPPAPSWVGHALVEEVALGQDEPSRIVFSADNNTGSYAAVTSGWKLVWRKKQNLYRLVDLHRDKSEKKNAVEDNAAQYARLENALVMWRERVEAPARK